MCASKVQINSFDAIIVIAVPLTLHGGESGFWKNLNKMEGQTVSHTHYVHTALHPTVSPPVVAVPWGTTIIQPSVVKTESDVMRTVKQP